MKLYLLPGCPFAHRATIALREKQLDFSPVFFAADSRPTELAALGAHAKSPTLFDGDARVWDSQIVMEYLEDRTPTPAMLPAAPRERAEARMLAARVDRELGPRQGILVKELRLTPPEQRDDAKVDAAKRELVGMLPAWDARLGANRFLLGAELGLADVTLYTLLAALASLADVAIPDELSQLRRWYAELSARPTTSRVMPSSA